MVAGAVLLLSARWATAADASRPDARALRVQRVVDRVRQFLEIPDTVVVELVATNPKVASVQPIKSRPGVFVLSVQDDFLDQLADDELEAMVSHELGHVWIYTHHPYLQTEQLANRVAMRRVSREQLERVYLKVWGTSGYRQELASFLGVAATPPVAPAETEASAAEPTRGPALSPEARDRQRP